MFSNNDHEQNVHDQYKKKTLKQIKYNFDKNDFLWVMNKKEQSGEK